MSSPILIHILSLDTIGGVEQLYVHYLQEAISRGKTIHYTCVSGKRPHDTFTEMFTKCMHKPFLEQYVFNIRLPQFLRFIIPIRRGMIEDLVKPTAWVYWNRIEEHACPGRSIYYEHGASWMVPVTKKRKQFLHNCADFVANSEAASIMLQKKWDISAPIHVVPNPLRPDMQLLDSPRKLHSKPLRLGFIGRLVPLKGPLVPLHVLKNLLDKKIPATLSIAGTGSQEAIMKKTATKLGISSSLQFCGSVFDIQSWFDSIDILIVPSIREPLGLVSLEAAARGIPVIAANVDGLAEVISHEKSGILINPKIPLDKAGTLLADRDNLPDYVVDPIKKELVEPKIIDPQDCVDAICRFLNTPSLYETCSMGALQKVQQYADFEIYYESLKSILENDPDVVESTI